MFLFSSVVYLRTLLLPKEIYPHESDTKISSTYFLTLTQLLSWSENASFYVLLSHSKNDYD